MPATKTKAKVVSNKLAFWETAIDLEGEPAKYLKRGETVMILGSAVTYGGLFADREYYKVQHTYYGNGYVRKEGLEVVTT